jgi:phosphatidylglycerol---prolipoprotein diacylglyceryl transferase
MALSVIPFPVIDPVAFNIGPFAIRWYSLAYIGALAGGYLYAYALLRNKRLWGDTAHLTPPQLGDLVLYMALAIVIGGRLGDVIFYEPSYYLAHPLEIVETWNGGMAFHGGVVAAIVVIWFFARKVHVPALTIMDICTGVAPIGIFLVRIANFIKPELWGRPTNVPWAMIFPDADEQPRHPSQLYEAFLEGLLLWLALWLVIRSGAFKRPGLVTGIACIGYGAARIVSEFFREPDPELERLSHGLTMGMVLSVPLLIGGVALVVYSARCRARSTNAAS